MNHEIDIDQLTESETHHFVAFASDIGISGRWPSALTVLRLGNGQPFSKIRWDEYHNYMLYSQDLGCTTIRIFNT